MPKLRSQSKVFKDRNTNGLKLTQNDYLMQKLARGDKQFKEGKFKQHELIEDDDNE